MIKTDFALIERDLINKDVLNKDSIYYEIFNNNESVGFFVLRIIKTNVISIDEIYINIESRGFGIGTEIINKIKSLLRTFGVNSLQLIVACDNEKAQKLYKELNFTFIPYIDDGYCYKMECIL